jgi:hypothetical protein
MAQRLIQENTDITLGYWGIRGLAQPIRYLLISADVPFSEIRLGVLQDSTPLSEDEENEEWEVVRSTLDMPFPNLPYLIDTSRSSRICLSQSNAILLYWLDDLTFTAVRNLIVSKSMCYRMKPMIFEMK